MVFEAQCFKRKEGINLKCMLIKCKLQHQYQVYRIARGCIPQLLTVGRSEVTRRKARKNECYALQEKQMGGRKKTGWNITE
jgi:hypothetical protein